MNIPQVDERIAAAVQAKRERHSPIASMLADEAIDRLRELRQQLEDDDAAH